MSTPALFLRLRFVMLFVAGAVVFLSDSANPASANTGHGSRLGGAEAQGPATPALTAIHHNPAMLGSLYGFNFSTNLRPGVDLLTVRRNEISNDGTPRPSFGTQTRLVNPDFGSFVGASFRLDPFAIGAGVYTLQNRFRLHSNEPLRFHLAPDPDFGCLGDCPALRSGGMSDFRTDISLAFAWNVFDSLSFGVSAHYPHVRRHFAYDNDTGQTSSIEGTGCDAEGAEIEDPICAERLSFTGRTRLRWFGLNPSGTRFDFALTLGLSWEVNDKVRLGLRYRTMPLLSRGEVTLHGKAKVCLAEEAAEASFSEVPACKDAPITDATLVEQLPREAAIGASLLLGQSDQWQLDGNLFWIDNCPGYEKSGRCANRDAQRLSLVGLERNVAVLPETTVYRGKKDMIGLELWGRYTLDHALAGPNVRFCDGSGRTKDGKGCIPRMDLLFGGGFESPGTRPSALNVRHSDGWLLRTTLGVRFRVPNRRNSIGTWYLIPGYGFDWLLPTKVGPGSRRFGSEKPAYDPAAAQSFLENGGDLNGPGANAVLEGRARPSNAGEYQGSLHTFTLGIRWSEDPPR